MSHIARYTTLAWLLALMTGCAVGPDFKRPAAPETTSYVAGELPEQTAATPGLAGEAQRFVHGKSVDSQWWKAFGSPELDELVASALKASPDLQAAQAALRAARETAAAQRGGFWPSLDLEWSSSREREFDEEETPLTLHTGQVSITYAPDVFGGNRREAEALRAETQEQHFEHEAVYMTLVSNVVSTAIEEASLRAQIEAMRDVIALSDKLLDITQRQYRLGHASGAELAAQETVLARAQAELPPLEKELAEQRNRLAVLTGRLPSEQVVQHVDLASLSLPMDLPVSLPSLLLEQRPDVRAAQEQLHAASARIGVAIAARLPNISLSATWGGSARQGSQLFRSGSGIWSVGAGLLQPLFRGGALMHEQRAAEALYEQAAAQYRGVVLAAFEDTANTLQAIVSDAQALNAASRAEAAARKSMNMARRQRELGEFAQADLILAQQDYQETAVALIQAQASRYTNTVALYQALGGWWQTPLPEAGE